MKSHVDGVQILMSVIQNLLSGGLSVTLGNFSGADRKLVNATVVAFAKYVTEHRISKKLPASLVTLNESNYLLAAKDSANFHIVFAKRPGNTTYNYRDFVDRGEISLTDMISQVELDIGEVIYAFMCPVNVSSGVLDKHAEYEAKNYLITLESTQNEAKAFDLTKHSEIAFGLMKFDEDHAEGTPTAFIMMQFGNTPSHKKILTIIKQSLLKHGITGVRADDKSYMDDLFPNIKVYMHACDFGISVFERITEEDFNPNVSLEVGYMLGMGKDVLLLKDRSLKSLHTDLTGKLYKVFDTLDVERTLPNEIERWLSDKGYIEPRNPEP